MPFELPALPYDYNSLAPHMSEETLHYHYGKHHAGYVDGLNDAIKDTLLADLSLEEIIRETVGKEEHTDIFNNAAQAWNHAFFWQCMAPGGGGAPEGQLAERLTATFGGVQEFKDKFVEAAGEQFGSGWAWLVVKNGGLTVMRTANANTPIAEELQPLLTCDVWEHAYYLDYRNERGEFVQTFLDHLVNWRFVADQLTGDSSPRYGPGHGDEAES